MAVIAYILQGLLIGGMEKGTLQLARYVQQLGYDVRLVLFDYPYLPGGGQYDAGPIPVTFIARRPGFDWTFSPRLADLFRMINTDLVHAQGSTALFYSAMAVARLNNRHPKLIGTFRNRPYSSALKIRMATKWASRRTSANTAVSRELSDWLLSTGWLDRCNTIPGGVDTSHFSPEGTKGTWRKRLGLSEETFLIGHVGRFDENKRQIDLIQAFRRLRSRIPDAALVLVGDGPTRHTIGLQTMDCSRIFYVQHITELPDFLRDIDTFVLCSQHEGTPRALLEAMACGRAVIATEVGGVPVVLNDSGAIYGVTVPPMCPEVLADRLFELAGDPEHRRRLGMLARDRVVRRFTSDREFSAYLKLYKNVMTGNDF